GKGEWPLSARPSGARTFGRPGPLGAQDLGRPLLGFKSSEELVRGVAQRRVRARRTGEPKLLASLVELADPDQELAQMEPDRLRTRKARCQGAEPRESDGRSGFREEADRRGGLCLGV